MRKTALKKQVPNRHKIIKLLRETYSDNLQTFMNNEGREIVLNLRKYHMFAKNYKNWQYQMELERKRGQFINISKGENKEQNDG